MSAPTGRTRPAAEGMPGRALPWIFGTLAFVQSVNEPGTGLIAILSIACLVAIALYGVYCQRVLMKVLVHMSIVLGIFMTFWNWALTGTASARLVMVGVGFCYMTATLIQLDLAARVYPPEIVATAFALLMAMVNLATSSASFLEGRFYAWGAERWSHEVAFHGLIVIIAVFTASCWLLVPFLPKENQAPVNTP